MWLLYGWISVYISKFIVCIFSWIGLIPRLFRRKQWQLGLYAGLPLGCLMFLAMWYGAFMGRYAIDTVEVTIESSRIPKQFDGFRIVQFSDAHVGTWGTDTTFVSALVDSINNLKPQAIVFTGDIVNRKTDEIKPFISVLSRLQAPYGVYSIMGNHDYGDYCNWHSEELHQANTRQLRKIQNDMGWHLLSDEHVWLKSGSDSIALAGVENWGEPPFPSYGNLDKAIEGLSGNDYTILLTHNPMHWHMIVRENPKVDISLSGHTHAMQMRIRTPWADYSPSALIYPEWQGLHEHHRSDGSKSKLYINIGCGEVGFPARIGAAPEITVITLKSGK